MMGSHTVLLLYVCYLFYVMSCRNMQGEVKQTLEHLSMVSRPKNWLIKRRSKLKSMLENGHKETRHGSSQCHQCKNADAAAVAPSDVKQAEPRLNPG